MKDAHTILLVFLTDRIVFVVAELRECMSTGALEVLVTVSALFKLRRLRGAFKEVIGIYGSRPST